MRDQSIYQNNKYHRKTSYSISVGSGSLWRELQAYPYPIDWCFIGTPKNNVHTPDKIAHKADIKFMLDIYRLLIKEI